MPPQLQSPLIAHTPLVQAPPPQHGSPMPPQWAQVPVARLQTCDPVQVSPAQHGWPSVPHVVQTPP